MRLDPGGELDPEDRSLWDSISVSLQGLELWA